MLLLAAQPVWAHIGSPGNFVEGSAGPYAVVVGTRPPGVFPGTMEVDLRVLPGTTASRASVGLDEEPPVSLRLQADGTGVSSVWLPSSDAHTLHVTVEGDSGSGNLNLALPGWTLHAPATRHYFNAQNMLWGAAVLVYFGCILVLAGGRQRRRNMKLAAGLIGTAFVLAACTWPIRPRPAGKTSLHADVHPDGRLPLHLSNQSERFDDLTPDAGKHMQLFAVREPMHDVLLHLHPQQVGEGVFGTQLPSIPPGTYTLFVDMVHRAGGQPAGEARTESAVVTTQFPAMTGTQMADPDDTATVLPTPQPGSDGAAGTQIVRLPDGYVMSLAVDGRLETKRTHVLTLSLLDPQGKPVADPALYLGAPAQAMVLSHDNAVFAYLHSGSTLPQLQGTAALAPSATTTVPYGFPSKGAYRLFAQMKHGSTVETAAFDLNVE